MCGPDPFDPPRPPHADPPLQSGFDESGAGNGGCDAVSAPGAQIHDPRSRTAPRRAMLHRSRPGTHHSQT